MLFRSTIDRQTGAFATRPGQHDGGEKKFLGRVGRFGGDDIVPLLLAQPRTAETIVKKMWREFVSPTLDPAEVQRLAAAFRRDYEIKPLLRAFLTSEAFRDPASRGTLIKSIQLTDNEDEIDCRYEKIKGLVLRTEFVKKA